MVAMQYQLMQANSGTAEFGKKPGKKAGVTAKGETHWRAKPTHVGIWLVCIEKEWAVTM